MLNTSPTRGGVPVGTDKATVCRMIRSMTGPGVDTKKVDEKDTVEAS